jgi:hypothetical protein
MKVFREFLDFTSKEVRIRTATIYTALEMVVDIIKKILEASEMMRCKICELAQFVFYAWLLDKSQS